MRQRELVKLIAQLGRLTHAQRDYVVRELSPQRNAGAVEVIERAAPARPPCPHCGHEHVVKNGRSSGLIKHSFQPFHARLGKKILAFQYGWPPQKPAIRARFP